MQKISKKSNEKLEEKMKLDNLLERLVIAEANLEIAMQAIDGLQKTLCEVVNKHNGYGKIMHNLFIKHDQVMNLGTNLENRVILLEKSKKQ